MNKSFRKMHTFSLTEVETNLLNQIKDKGINKAEVIRRGLVSYAEELNIPLVQD